MRGINCRRGAWRLEFPRLPLRKFRLYRRPHRAYVSIISDLAKSEPIRCPIGPKRILSSMASGSRAIGRCRTAHPRVLARLERVRRRARVRRGAPDLDQHCARLNRSAKTMWLKPSMSVEAMIELAREGLKKFKPGAHLYIRPMYWAERTASARCRPIRNRPASCCPSTRRRCPSRRRRLHHPLALRQAAADDDADRGEGRLPLSEQRARADGGAHARLRQLHPVRHARQCRGARDRQCVRRPRTATR